MTKAQARGYTLPIPLLEVIEAHPKPRSQIFTEAILAAHKDLQVIIDSLTRRIKNQTPSTARTARVTVSVTEKTINCLAELTNQTQLGTEHVLRLALEDYIHKRGW